MVSLRWCTVCAAEAVLEGVPCADGHGGDCPELVCRECGYVLVLGAVFDDPVGAGSAGAGADCSGGAASSASAA
jgi:hypothetical protein